jgi:PAS domain S-box-containing protein
LIICSNIKQEKKKAKKMISNFNYKSILNHINEAIFIHKQNGEIIDVNDTMLKMYGYEYHEIVGGKVPAVSNDYKGFTAEIAQQHINAAIRGESPLFEWLAKDKDGHPFWVEVSLSKLENEEENLILAVVRDISKRHPESIAYTKLEDFKNIITNLSHRFISIPIERIPAEIDYALEYLGKFYKSDRSYVFLYTEDNQFKSNTNEWCNTGITPYKSSLQHLKNEGFIWEYNQIKNNQIINIPDVSLMDSDASVEKQEFEREGILSLLMVPMLHNNRPIGFLGLDSVQHKRKWMKQDEEVLAVMGTIIGNALIRKRNEEKLKVAIKKAEESDRLKTAFLANMSHEIRTPMNGIVGFSQLLTDPLTSKQELNEYGEIIYNSSLQLLAIINDIIDISKIEAGIIEAMPTKVDITKLVSDLEKFYSYQVNEKSLEFSLECTLEPGFSIMVDKGKLRQILGNLISNAIKYTNEGTITLGCKNSDSTLTFYIQDTGIGMDKEMQETAFDRFTRARDEYTQKNRGTGLGLSICKALTHLLNGSISLNSIAGKGTTFTVSIPI